MDTLSQPIVNEAGEGGRADGEVAPLLRGLGLDWVIVFAVGLALYVLTCAPDVLMGDSGVYQLRVPQFPPFPPLTDTLVQVHPLYLIVAKLFTWIPVGSIAYRVNLVSPPFAAMAVASAFVSIRLLTGSRWAAAIGALAIGLGHTFWAFAVVAECLSLGAAFLTTEILLLILFARTGRTAWYFLAALLNGLSIANHMMGGLATPVYLVLSVVWIRRERLAWSDAILAGLFWVLGTGLYLWLILRTLLQTGDLGRVIQSATTGGWPALNVGITPSLVGKVVAYVGLQYPTLLIVLLFVSLRSKVRDASLAPVKWAIVGVAGMHFLFAARYPRPDQYSFFVSFYAAAGLLIGLGAWSVIQRWPWTRWVGVVLAIAPVGVYAVLPTVARHFEINPFTRALPYRDPYEFFLKPWQQGNTGVRRYVTEVFEILPEEAMLFGDPTPAGAFFYVQQVEGKRPDLDFAWNWDRMPLGDLVHRTIPPRWKRPVYCVANEVPYAPKLFVDDCELIPEGVVYRVELPRRLPRDWGRVPKAARQR